MQVLVIDAYAQTKIGRASFAAYKRILSLALEESSREKHDIVVRKLDDLRDYICDWQHDILNEKAKHNCLKFDKLDLICLGGDMRVCPWDPIFTHIIILLSMCHLVEKPVLGCGSGAFAGVYQAATQGARFNVLNGPLGDTLDKLSTYPRYSIGTTAYPSGWFDSNSGDVYSYDHRSALWRPMCNIGVHRIPSSGKPPSPDKLDIDKKYSRDDHSLTIDQAPEAIDEKEIVVAIRNVLVQNHIVRNISSRSFIVSALANWHINKDGGIPSSCGIVIVADDQKGRPVIFTRGKSLYLAFQIDEGRGFLTTKQILLDYFSEAFISMKTESFPRKLIFDYLFGERTRGSWRFESGVVRYDMSPCLAAMPVPTRLPEGPVCVDPPMIDLFFPPDKEQDTYIHVGQSRKGTTLGKKPTLQFRNPTHSRSKRLDLFLRFTGNSDSIEVGHKALQLSEEEDPYGFNDPAPESYRENIQGKVLDSKNIKGRSVDRTAHYARGQIVKSPNKQVPILEDVYPPFGAQPPTTPPLTRSPSGIRRTFNRTAHAYSPSGRDDGMKSLSFCPSDWELLQKEMHDTEYNRKMGYESGQKSSAKYDDTAHLMATQREANHLPSYHPLNTNRNNLTARRVPVVRPKSNYKTLEKIFTSREMEEDKKEYTGAYSDVYRSAVEQEIYEYNQSKKKFVADKPFIAIFGKASSLPVRPSCTVLHEPYIEDKEPQRTGFRGQEDKKKRVGGPWYPAISSRRAEGTSSLSARHRDSGN